MVKRLYIADRSPLLDLTNDLLEIDDFSSDLRRGRLDPSMVTPTYASGRKADNLTRVDWIPCYGANLIKGEVLQWIFDHQKDGYQLFDTEIYSKDGVITDFKLLVVTAVVRVIDFKNSDVDWVIDNKWFAQFDKLTFLSDTAMEGLHVAKDFHYRRTVFSDVFAEKIGDKAKPNVYFGDPDPSIY